MMALFNEDAQDVQRQAVGVGGPQGLKMNRGNPNRFGPPQNGGVVPPYPRPEGGPPPMGRPYDPGRMGGSPYGAPGNGGISLQGGVGPWLMPGQESGPRGGGLPGGSPWMPGDPGTQPQYQDAPPYGGQGPGNGNPGWIPGPLGMPHNQGPIPPPHGPRRPGDITPGGGNPGDGGGTPPPGEQPPFQFQRPWLGQTGRQQVANPLGLGHGGGHPAFQPPQTEVPINFANGFNNPNAQQGGAYNGQMRPQPVAPRESPMFPSRPKQQPQQQAGGNDGLNNYLRSF